MPLGRMSRLVPTIAVMFAGALTTHAACSALAAEGAAQAEESPIHLNVTYAAEVMHNARGGLRTGTGYRDDLQLEAAVDAEKLLGMTGGAFYVSGHVITYDGFSAKYVGEAQTVSNLDVHSGVRLYEAWYEQAIGSQFSLKAGLYDLNSEFDADPPAALFINSSHGIGIDFSQTGQNGPSIYPVTSLAARLAWRGSDGFSLQFAVLDAVPGDPGHPRRTTVKLAKGDGALLVGEAGYLWNRGQIAIGGWGYTARFDDLVLKTAAGTPVQHRNNRGAYAFITTRLLGDAEATPSVDVFFRAGMAETSINQVGTFFGAGLARFAI